jgi:hypothetical protein
VRLERAKRSRFVRVPAGARECRARMIPSADSGASQAQTGGTNENRMVRKQNGLFERRKWVCRVTELSLGNGRRRGSSVNVVTAMVGSNSRPGT